MGQACASASSASPEPGDTDGTSCSVKPKQLDDHAPVIVTPLWKQQAEADNELAGLAASAAAQFEAKAVAEPRPADEERADGQTRGTAPGSPQSNGNKVPSSPSKGISPKGGKKRPAIPTYKEWCADHIDAWKALSEEEQQAKAFTLVEAGKAGDADKVLKLVAAGTNINAVDHEGRACIRTSAKHGQLEVVEAAFQLGAKVNAVNAHIGYTPMHCACHFKKWNVAVFLVRHGADLTKLDKNGKTPTELCKNEKFAKWLRGKPSEVPPPAMKQDSQKEGDIEWYEENLRVAKAASLASQQGSV